jgi:hypothetical protein
MTTAGTGAIARKWLLAGALGAASFAPARGWADTGYALVDDGLTLLMFDTATPGTIARTLTVTGLQPSEVLRAIDFRPVNGGLYGVSSGSRFYLLNLATGAATVIGVPFDPLLSANGSFGMDFDPLRDRLRVVSTQRQDLRISPSDGTVSTEDPPLAFASTDPSAGAIPRVAAEAYSDNFAGTDRTLLYAIDLELSVLCTQNPPNDSTLNTVGSLNLPALTTVEEASMDIATSDGTAYAALTTRLAAVSTSSLYRINLATGAATGVGTIGDGTSALIGLAIHKPIPQANLVGLSSTNTLIFFSSHSPLVAERMPPVTGLPAGTQLLGLERRPLTQQLYAVSANRLYLIDAVTAAATAVGSGAFTPALVGEVALDWDPVSDRLRAITDSDQNLLLNPNDGTAVSETPVTYSATDSGTGLNPAIGGLGYADSFGGSESAALYAIDPARDVLIRSTVPGSGIFTTVGPLLIDAQPGVTLEIAPGTNVAFAGIVPAGATVSRLYAIDLTTGAASLMGQLIQVTVLRGLTTASAVAPASLVALSANNKLMRFEAERASQGPASWVTITGLQPSENLLGIDFRPQDGLLYGIGSTHRLYTLNLTSGAATPVGSGPLSTALNGVHFGFDFNPLVDRLRVVSDADQNLRLNPADATVTALDDPLRFAAGDLHAAQSPSVIASAYLSNFVGASSTALVGIDSGRDVLVLQEPPNDGMLRTLGSLGVDVDGLGGFDVSATGNTYLALIPAGQSISRLYSVNLLTGALRLASTIAGGEPVRGLAVIPHGRLQLSASTYTASEGSQKVEVTVQRLAGILGRVGATLKTVNGTAKAPDDFAPGPFPFTLEEGETSKVVEVALVLDGAAESDEDFTVSISAPTGSAVLAPAANITALVTLQNSAPASAETDGGLQPSEPDAGTGEPNDPEPERPDGCGGCAQASANPVLALAIAAALATAALRRGRRRPQG